MLSAVLSYLYEAAVRLSSSQGTLGPPSAMAGTIWPVDPKGASCKQEPHSANQLPGEVRSISLFDSLTLQDTQVNGKHDRVSDTTFRPLIFPNDVTFCTSGSQLFCIGEVG